MSELSFEPGDVVRLRSGGPLLTVSDMKQQDPGLLHVEWFSGADLRRDILSMHCVVHEFGPSAPVSQIERIIRHRFSALNPIKA